MQRTRRLDLAAWILAAALVLAGAAQAVVPQTLNYQGYLTDPAGGAIDGSVVIAFSIYGVETGGSPLWTEMLTVEVDNGLFSVRLGGAANPFPGGMFDDALFMGLTVGGDTEAVPRRALDSAAFAFRAEDADTLRGASKEDLDQSLHVTDTDNPHAVTAAQTGAATPTDVSTAIANSNHLSSVTAGPGLAILAGQPGSIELGADFTTTQMRISSGCPSGASINSIFEDGDVVCEADDNSPNLTLALVGTTLDLVDAAGTLSVDLSGFDQSALLGNTVLDLDTLLTKQGASQMRMNGTSVTTNASGSFSVFNFSPLDGTVLMGSFAGIDNAPQLRFQESGTPDFIDIGQDASGHFVVENGNDEAKLTVQQNGLVRIGNNGDSSQLMLNSAVLGNVTAVVRGREGDLAYLDIVRPTSAGTFSELFRVLDNSIELLGTGAEAFKPGGGAWAAISDRRLKKNVQTLNGTLERLLALRGVTYEYLDPESIGQNPGSQIGFIAQEVEAVFPTWVGEHQGHLYVAPKGFEALTVTALRELRAEKDAQIEALRAQNAALEARLRRLETRLDAAE